jgi:hypothetical protein
MDYQRIYNEFIADRRGCTPEGYTERHHILPKAEGGDNSPENLIDLSAEDHFFAHVLLARIYPATQIYALWMLVTQKRYKGQRARKHYAANRGKFACLRVGMEVTVETREKLSQAAIGKPCTPLRKQQLRVANLGKTHSPETRAKLSASLRGRVSGMKGKTHSPETRAKLSAAALKQFQVKHPRAGATHSMETKLKISEAKCGKPTKGGWVHSEESKKKMSDAKRGLPGNRLGCKLTEESRKRISEAKLGRALSAEARQRMSEAQRERRARERRAA